MSDWHNADHQNLGTYRGFLRLVVSAATVIALALAIMAITLL
jgi:hypothetical protein